MKKFVRQLLAMLLGFGIGSTALAGVIVIANPNVKDMDIATVKQIYTGKIIEWQGVSVTPVNVTPSALRNAFMEEKLAQSDDKYIAYWVVRRSIGKGYPPKEMPSTDVVDYVKSTPGAIGYVDANTSIEGVKVLLK